MAITSAEELARLALDFNLLDQWQLQDVLSQFGSREVGIDDLRKALLGRDLLTFYQIEHLIAGDRTSFFYGDYKVLYLVGTGTFARVYRATNTHSGEQVAVKVLRKRFCESKEEADRFYREGQMGMELKHPNIVPIYDVATEGNTPYLVIEFIEGRNLREFIKVRKKMEPIDATRLVLDVSEGLDYAFQKGIFHRDVKLSNVLVSVRGQAKLVDFGLAGADKNISDELLVKNPNPRAIDYAGLERATGVHKNDPRSDIFFVGCMYYQMLSGKAAMTTTSDRTQRLNKGRYKEIRPIGQVAPGIPDDIAGVVNRAIAFHPDRRYQTPGEMAADLRRVLERAQQREQASADNASAAEAASPAKAAQDDGAAREGLDSYGNPRKLMIVEGDYGMQDVFRDRLKRNGYRVLLLSDAARALARFKEDAHSADVVVFSSGALKEAALEAFNTLGETFETSKVPAVLLLGDGHGAWQAQANLAPHRAVIAMPIKLRQLRETLARVIAAAKELA